MTKPLLLLWTDGAEPYARAIAEAGLADRLRIETLPRAATPDDAQLAEAEAMLSWGPPAGMLTRMPRLRFVQALTAGVEHWLARADLPADLALSCARGTHRVQMPENILGALFHITKPYAAIVGDNAAARWTRRVSTTLAGQTLGILGLGAIGAELARKAAALEMRVIGTKRGAATIPHVERVVGPGAHRRGPGRERLRGAAAARHAGDRELHRRGAPGADEEDRLAAEFRPRRADQG